MNTRVLTNELDRCASLIYCMVLHMNEDGCADSDQVLKSHNLLTHQKLKWIPGSDEYRELLNEGFVYTVRINAGKTSALKFQKPYADQLKTDAYRQLLSILNRAPAVIANDPSAKKADGKSRRQKTPIQKLITRINREITKKKYLSDILISEDEYDLLKTELYRIIKKARRSKRIESSPLLAVGLVQVACRVYQDGNFWGPFYEEIGLSKGDGAEQRIIGTAFYEVLKDYDRVFVSPNKYVQNILLHCFVTDPYLDSYFSFLYTIYTYLLDRDLYQLDKSAMSALIDRADRSHLLVKNTADAIKANPRGAKIRIRNHLKLLDKLFWDPDYTLCTSNRTLSKLQLWVRHSEKMLLESKSGRVAGARGKKHFSRPYFYFDQLQFAFRLVLPQQVVIGDDPDLRWNITGQIEKDMEPEIIEAIVGYRVQECAVTLTSWRDLLGAFKIKLIDHEGNAIRTFSMPKADVRIFDTEGYQNFTQSLYAGQIYTVSDKNSRLLSSSFSESHEYDGIVLSLYHFEEDDILLLPNGHAISIGKETIASGIAGNSVVPNARCILQTGETLSLMFRLPHLILRTSEQKAAGTCIEINLKRYSLLDIASMSFPIDDGSRDNGYWIELDKIGTPINGIYEIIADIPGGATKTWRFVLLNCFEMSFDDAPYTFEPRGVVRFNEWLNIQSLETGCKKDTSGNVFQFELAKVGRSIDFSLQENGFICTLQIDIPALFTSFDGDIWSAERPDAIWHSELPDMIYISSTQQTITLYTDEATDDTSSGTRNKVYSRKTNESYIACDIRWFKSYLDNGKNISALWIQLESGSTELLHVVRHSIPISCSVFQVDNGNAICVHAVILGKGSYYADVYRDGILLANKVCLENGNCTINKTVENGEYAVELFETEEDDSGFEDAVYAIIGKFYSAVVNPYDMSHRSFQILYVEKDADTNRILDLSFDYYVEDLVRTKERDVYSGMMVVEAGNKQLAAFPVFVFFLDMNDPSRVSISYKDEYNDPMSFLYDTKRKGILKEENPKLPKLTCYRRYTFLDSDDDLFRIEFVERENSNYRRIGYDLVFEESIYDFAFKSTVTKIAERKPATRDVTWRRGAYPYILQTHISNIVEFGKWTREDLQNRFCIPDPIMDSIESTLALYGVFFHRKEIEQVQNRND